MSRINAAVGADKAPQMTMFDKNTSLEEAFADVVHTTSSKLGITPEIAQGILKNLRNEGPESVDHLKLPPLDQWSLQQDAIMMQSTVGPPIGREAIAAAYSTLDEAVRKELRTLYGKELEKRLTVKMFVASQLRERMPTDLRQLAEAKAEWGVRVLENGDIRWGMNEIRERLAASHGDQSIVLQTRLLETKQGHKSLGEHAADTLVTVQDLMRQPGIGLFNIPTKAGLHSLLKDQILANLQVRYSAPSASGPGGLQTARRT